MRIWKADQVYCYIANDSFLEEDFTNRVAEVYQADAWQVGLWVEAASINILLRFKLVIATLNTYLTVWLDHKRHRGLANMSWSTHRNSFNHASDFAESGKERLPGRKHACHSYLNFDNYAFLNNSLQLLDDGWSHLDFLLPELKYGLYLVYWQPSMPSASVLSVYLEQPGVYV